MRSGRSKHDRWEVGIRFAGLTLSAVMLGCQPPGGPADGAPRPFDIVHSHPLIEVGVDPSLPVCGGSLDYIDRFAERYVDVSMHGPYDEPIQFYYVSAELAHEICGTSACAGGGYAYSPHLTHTHEFVHAARQRQQVPWSFRFFEEGIAQLHDAKIRPLWADGFVAADVLQFPEHLPGSHYDQAGHLMSYVRHRFSYHTVEMLLDEVVDVATEDELEEAFVEALGIGVEQLDADYRSQYPHCDGVGWTEMPVECADEPLPWVFDENGRGSIERTIPNFACSHPDAVGPNRDRIWTSFVVDVEKPGLHLIQVPDILGMTIEFGACELGCDRGIALQSTQEDLSRVAELPVGRHIIRLSRRLDDPGPVGFRVLGPSI